MIDWRNNSTERLLACLAGLVALLHPGAAWAAGGGGGSLDVVLILVTVVGLAYLVTHLLLERIAERFGVVSGIEYVLLGVVIFQFIVPMILPEDRSVDTVLYQLRPILVLGTGSLGLMWGLRAVVGEPDRTTRRAVYPTIVISSVTLAMVVVLPAILVWAFYGVGQLVDLVPLLLAVGGIAMVASDKPIRSLVSFLDAKGRSVRLAKQVARGCSLIAIVVFGLVFCIDNPSSLLASWSYQGVLWLAVHLVVGAALGAVFAAFLRREVSEGQILTVLIGMVVFSSGLASSLNLSPIFVNFVLGVVLTNTSDHAYQVADRLESIEHPLFIVLCLFAGAKLDFSVAPWTYAMVGPYLMLRIAGRWLGGLMAPVETYDDSPSLPSLARVLHAPGALSVAMALDFLMLFGESGGQFVATPNAVHGFYGAIIAAILISEIHAHTSIRDWLIDATGVSPRRSVEAGEDTSTREGG